MRHMVVPKGAKSRGNKRGNKRGSGGVAAPSSVPSGVPSSYYLIMWSHKGYMLQGWDLAYAHSKKDARSLFVSKRGNLRIIGILQEGSEEARESGYNQIFDSDYKDAFGHKVGVQYEHRAAARKFGIVEVVSDEYDKYHHD